MSEFNSEPMRPEIYPSITPETILYHQANELVISLLTQGKLRDKEQLKKLAINILEKLPSNSYVGVEQSLFLLEQFLSGESSSQLRTFSEVAKALGRDPQDFFLRFIDSSISHIALDATAADSENLTGKLRKIRNDIKKGELTFPIKIEKENAENTLKKLLEKAQEKAGKVIAIDRTLNSPSQPPKPQNLPPPK